MSTGAQPARDPGQSLTLEACLGKAVHWADTGDPEAPWHTQVEGLEWAVRLNDFPDEQLYSLVVGGAEVGAFDDWPACWHRSI